MLIIDRVVFNVRGVIGRNKCGKGILIVKGI